MGIFSAATELMLVNGISNKLGIKNNTAKLAIAAVVPLIVKGLQNNSKSQGGASGILGAITGKHNGGILDTLGDFLGNDDEKDGNNILSHILGGKKDTAASAIGKNTGLSAGQIASIMAIVAPVVMGAIGKESQEKNVSDEGGLQGLLGGLVDKIGGGKESKEMGLLDSFLSSDDDDDDTAMDKLKDIGTSFLGNLLKD